MGEAEEPLRVQTLLSDAHLDERPPTPTSTPKHTTVEAGWEMGVGDAEGRLQNHPPKEKHGGQQNLCLSQEVSLQDVGSTETLHPRMERRKMAQRFQFQGGEMGKEWWQGRE